MKKKLADSIAEYIKVLIARDENRQIEIQRAELAETFSCVPSQVTYVLGTRFRVEDGYYTVSRRGNQGFVRITEYKREGNDRDKEEALLALLAKLYQQELLNQKEMDMLKYIILKLETELPPEYHRKIEQEIAAALLEFLNID